MHFSPHRKIKQYIAGQCVTYAAEKYCQNRLLVLTVANCCNYLLLTYIINFNRFIQSELINALLWYGYPGNGVCTCTECHCEDSNGAERNGFTTQPAEDV